MSRYYYNKNYFFTIDTPDKAYWFGFLCADGSITRFYKGTEIRSMSVEVTVKSDDEEHLKKYLRALESNTPIQHRTVHLKATNKDYTSCRSVVNNTHLCKTLIKHGCTPCKSLTLSFPEDKDVPRYLINHFMRGYFDGDGCFSQYQYEHELTTVWTLCGTMPFLQEYGRILSENGVTLSRVPQRTKPGTQIYEMRLYGRTNIARAMDFLYRDSTPETRLDRKYEAFLAAKLDYEKPEGRNNPLAS